MARISAAQFGRNVKSVCAQSEIVMRVASIREGGLHLHFRIYLVDRSFLDVYYNQENGKTAFAHVDDSSRILAQTTRWANGISTHITTPNSIYL